MSRQTFNIKESAHLLSISEEMIKVLIEEGELYYQIENKEIRISLEQLKNNSNAEAFDKRLNAMTKHTK